MEQLLAKQPRDLSAPPAEIVAQLVAYGYLTPCEGGWLRAIEYDKGMQEEMRELMLREKLVKGRLKYCVNSDGSLSQVRPDLDKTIAEWFGYPQHKVFPTGRIHILEDDEA